MKKNRGYESNWGIIHLCMEMSQGSSLCSFPKQTKCHFFIYKIGEQEGSTGPSGRRGRGIGSSEKGEDMGKECKRLNIVQIRYTHGCKRKNDTS
jgi:hypothetical protein